MSLINRLSPLTHEFGFIEAGAERIGEWYRSWRASIGKPVEAKACEEASLEELLARLLPFTSVQQRRCMLVPTRSAWTAYFDNRWPNADAAVCAHFASELKCHAVRVVCARHEVGSDPRRPKGGQWGARMFEYYGSERTEWLNTIRSVAVWYDDGRWSFEENGRRLGGENPRWYSSKSVRSRFSEEDLSLLLRQLGIEAFDTSFYEPRGTMFSVITPAPASSEEYSLEEASAHWWR